MNYRIEYGGIGWPLLVDENGRRWGLAAHPAWQGSIAVCNPELWDLCNRDVEARIIVEEYVANYWPRFLNQVFDFNDRNFTFEIQVDWAALQQVFVHVQSTTNASGEEA